VCGGHAAGLCGVPHRPATGTALDHPPTAEGPEI
jgi:hypothetical protein